MSLQHSPSSETDSSSANLEITILIHNLKVHNCVRTILQLVPIMSQILLIHALPSYSFMMHFNIILPSTPKSCK